VLAAEKFLFVYGATTALASKSATGCMAMTAVDAELTPGAVMATVTICYCYCFEQYDNSTSLILELYRESLKYP